jgi:hypothetical protein
MPAHHKLFATTPGRKITRPKERQIGPSAALRRLPDPSSAAAALPLRRVDALHRAPRRAWPNEPICTHQIDYYLPSTALTGL